MGLHETVSWYQRKIGTYDKQKWEKTVEQRILAGFKHVLTKTAKLKTDLIDVDLVRGSSFAKTKPKHGLATVTKLAIARWIFLPLYYSWWIQQTSVVTFGLLLVLYILQILNICIYYHFTSVDEKLLSRVSPYEILVPAAMMLVLSLIHSEIVATSTGQLPARCGGKRGRRGKRRHDRTDRKNTDTAEVAASSAHVSDDMDAGDIPDQVGLRQRVVAWRAPLREPSPPCRSVEDDGSESLASHASSEDVPRAAPPPVDGEAHACANGHMPGMGLGVYCPRCRGEAAKHYTDTESEIDLVQPSPQRLLQRRRSTMPFQPLLKQEHYDSSGESDACCSPATKTPTNRRSAGQSSHEWLGVTTNSEECSVESGGDESTGSANRLDDHPFAFEFEKSSSSPISPSCAPSDRVSCTIWEHRDVKRGDLSVLDISSSIIARVESMPENLDYFYGGVCISFVISLVPSLCRLLDVSDGEATDEPSPATPAVIPDLSFNLCYRISLLLDTMFGDTPLERMVTLIALLERFCLACLFIFLAAVAERTLKQRFLYAKLFSQLTSFRRARRSQIPHFRLNKVRNIKTWLSVRSYLKKRGPQRSVDVIVSAAFIITLLLLSFITVELLKDSARLQSEYSLEALLWCLALGIFMLRFMTLGNKTNRKYRNPSVLLTEQINLYLQIEQKPNKKDELMVANSVLKLAADLLKELESPFKISGLSANPYVYTITKVVILSALSGVLSEMLGFKLKLHNIKISSLK